MAMAVSTSWFVLFGSLPGVEPPVATRDYLGHASM
jgi:hypothetical protein